MTLECGMRFLTDYLEGDTYFKIRRPQHNIERCRNQFKLAADIQSKGDGITDMTENLAAEQKARTTYDNILRLVDDPDVRDAIKFLRAREIVHFQRFGEGLRLATDKLDEKNFYAFNPAFDKNCIK